MAPVVVDGAVMAAMAAGAYDETAPLSGGRIVRGAATGGCGFVCSGCADFVASRGRGWAVPGVSFASLRLIDNGLLAVVCAVEFCCCCCWCCCRCACDGCRAGALLLIAEAALSALTTTVAAVVTLVVVLLVTLLMIATGAHGWLTNATGALCVAAVLGRPYGEWGSVEMPVAAVSP